MLALEGNLTTARVAALSLHRANLNADRMNAALQHIGNLLVGETLADEHQDFAFSRCQDGIARKKLVGGHEPSSCHIPDPGVVRGGTS